MSPTGVVKFYSEKRGYGFIEWEGEDAFFHISAIAEEAGALSAGDELVLRGANTAVSGRRSIPASCVPLPRRVHQPDSVARLAGRAPRRPDNRPYLRRAALVHLGAKDNLYWRQATRAWPV